MVSDRDFEKSFTHRNPPPASSPPTKPSDRDRQAAQAIAMADVLAERRRQDHVWGPPNREPEMFITILMEEVGEAAKAILHRRFGGPEAKGLRNELVQVAAVALSMLECCDSNEWMLPHPKESERCDETEKPEPALCDICGEPATTMVRHRIGIEAAFWPVEKGDIAGATQYFCPKHSRVTRR